MKKRMLLLWCLGMGSLHAQSILDGTFEDFLRQAIPAEDQADFRSFYNELLYRQQRDKQSTKSKKQKKQHAYKQQLQELGRNAVDIRDTNLARTIKFQNNRPEQQTKISTFYFRYGAYEEFLKQRAFKNYNILVKAKSYMRDMGNKVISWFGSWRREKNATKA